MNVVRVEVGQALKGQANITLGDHGEIVWQGWGDSSSTTWVFFLETEKVPEELQDVLWEEGFGWVHSRLATDEEAFSVY